jgi:hypothetical protein
MLESVVGQWDSSTPLKEAKYTLDVYSIGEFIPSQLLNVHRPKKEGAIPTSAGWRVESTVLVSPFNLSMPSLQRDLVSASTP